MNTQFKCRENGSTTRCITSSRRRGSVRRLCISMMTIAGLSSAMQARAQIVSVTLASPQSGTVMSPGESVEWTMSVTASTGDNQGLAFISADLVQSPSNPAYFDIPHANDVPPVMAAFASPLGVSNPPEEGMSTGYIGTRVGPPGARNLLQIGGGQTLFGYALSPEIGLAQTAYTISGVGQNGSVIVATGSFEVPDTGGVYQFELSNVLANVLSEANQPPNFSLAQAATVDTSGAFFTFSVIGTSCNPYDANCDGSVNGLDIQGFIVAILDPSANHCSGCVGDTDSNGIVDTADVQAFANYLLEQ